MMEEMIYDNLEAADSFLRNFFRSDGLKQYFSSIFRNIRQQLPSVVIRGRDKDILGIAPAECKYLFYITPQDDRFYVKFKAGDKMVLEIANFNQIYQFAVNSVQRYKTFPDDYRIQKKTPSRKTVTEYIPEPKINIDFSETGNVFDVETGEILDFEDRINTLGYYMNKLDEKKEQFEQENAELIDTVEKLKSSLKDDFSRQGEGLIYGRVSVSVSQPRISWDSKGLTRYAEQHPEINEFQKVGDPIVSFRLIKEKQNVLNPRTQ